MKRAYYFLKHSSDDADKTIDVENFADVNFVFTLFGAFLEVFGYLTNHMVYLRSYAAVEDPTLLQESARDQMLEESKDLRAKSPKERLASLQNVIALKPEVVHEVEEDTKLAHRLLALKEAS